MTPDNEFGIGQVGLGSITGAHREGYRIYDQPVVAGFDPNPEARARFAAEEPGAAVYDTLEALLADPRVGVVDVATPHHRDTRLPVVEQIAAAGTPMLIQKPLAYSYADAVEMANAVDRAGVTAMVNQNMCFVPGSLRLIDALMKDRVVGVPSFAEVTVRYVFDLPNHPWFGKDDRWWTGALTVHHFGLLQLLFGPPETVYAVTGRDVSQPGVTVDGYGHLLLRYPNGMNIAIVSTGTYYGTDPMPHGNEKIWVQGPEGLVDWRPEEGLAISRRTDAGIDVSRIEWDRERRWFPDAFGLTMAHFRQALAAGETPLCSIDDNLHVSALIEAAYRSSAENRVVPLAEIMGDRWNPDYGTGWSHGFGRWAPPVVAGVPA
ncbi:Gfo/Idh/MocA family oxidoreductase [Microbacterium sp. ET2]|uniref:Gfo/Idh/MocA family protein n=1 Tax=Microbacterium albipurpureum TaxID=3050384 RepID=UPI00259D0FD6|nr:Gfo/Idh/MocA family oxidoreductase [Microbacterium sp. ET2 (Ac-2212)]WJL94896.1 Gfo/Idh/MocA family oxidoreductase [Microbacterium sp. ET2 (Ac-2212)]